MTDKTKVIVQGEASESDDDDLAQDSSKQTVSQEVDSTTQNKSTTVASNVVVSGEASESDDEVEDQHSVPTGVGIATGPTDVVVSGEAPESEDEDINSSALPSLNVQPTEAGDEASLPSPDSTSLPVLELKPKFNSLLNRKLRERNIALRKHIVDTVHHAYISAGKSLQNIALQIQKSQIVGQDVSHNMRNATNGLLRIEDTLSIFSTCEILPDITFPSESVATP